jgi:hypothetical protein
MTTAIKFFFRRALLGRDVGQSEHILGNPVVGHEAEGRPRSGEIRPAVTKHNGVQVDAILIDQAKLGEAVRQARASNFDLCIALGLELADGALEIVLDKPGVRADRLQRARDDPFRLVPPRRREGVFVRAPFGMIVVPVPHDLVHLTPVHAARLPPSFLDEVAEERGAWRNFEVGPLRFRPERLRRGDPETTTRRTERTDDRNQGHQHAEDGNEETSVSPQQLSARPDLERDHRHDA